MKRFSYAIVFCLFAIALAGCGDDAESACSDCPDGELRDTCVQAAEDCDGDSGCLDAARAVCSELEE